MNRNLHVNLQNTRELEKVSANSKFDDTIFNERFELKICLE